MIKSLVSLLERIVVGRKQYMPNYVDQLTIDKGYLISVNPSDIRKSAIKSSPFYNGDDIWFDLKVKKPFKSERRFRLFPKARNVDEVLGIEWELFNRSEKSLQINPTHETYQLRNKKVKDKTGTLRRTSYDFSSDNYVICTIYKAIHVGRLWDFNRYDLRIKKQGEYKEAEIIVEFTIRDIDEHGENTRMLVIGALLTITVSYIVALITALFVSR